MYNIGLLIDYMHSSFHTHLISWIANAASKQEATLWCFEYTPLDSTTKNVNPSTLLNIIHKKNLHGLMIAPGSLEQQLCHEHFSAFIKQHLAIPLLFLLSPTPTDPYIRIDNKEGMKKLLFHLFAEHNYRRPGFIRGSARNYDMNNRFKTFISLCKDYGITCEKALVYQGDNSFHSGRRAVAEWVKKKTLSCDVIIAANDLMAAGTMLELQATYSIRIPEDIAVTGFDNIETARFTNPPLTTINQPFYDLACKAVKMMIQLIKGKTVYEKTIMQAELIIRDSCGCSQRKREVYTHEKEKHTYKRKNDQRGINAEEPYILLYEKQYLRNYNDENLDKIMKYLGRHYADSELSISKVEQATGISALKIAKVLQEKFNIHFKKLLNKIRCTEAKRLLLMTDRYITDIAFQVGYNSRNHFYKAFIQSEGVSPKEYKHRQQL